MFNTNTQFKHKKETKQHCFVNLVDFVVYENGNMEYFLETRLTRFCISNLDCQTVSNLKPLALHARELASHAIAPIGALAIS